jgi:hypothetical protein
MNYLLSFVSNLRLKQKLLSPPHGPGF